MSAPRHFGDRRNIRRRPPVDPERARRWDADKTARIVWLRPEPPPDVAALDDEHARNGRRAVIFGCLVALGAWALLTIASIAVVRLVL